MSNGEFNQKYSLSPSLAKMLHFKDKSNNFKSAIAGKPKIMWMEMTKRFFTNPISLIAFIVFILLITFSIIFTITSPFKPKKPIYDINVLLIKELPPSYNSLISKSYDLAIIITDPNQVYVYSQHLLHTENTKFGVEYSEAIKKFFEEIVYKKYSENVVGQSMNITYDYADFIKGNILWQKLINLPNKGTITFDEINEIYKTISFKKPILGSDDLGHDIWTTTWFATGNSIKIALIVATIETFIGVAIGAYLGFHAGKWIDTIIMRIIEIFSAPPTLIWLLLFVSILGTTDLALISALIFVGWTSPISGTRMFIITVKDEEYIIASKSVGAKKNRLIFMHALPAIIGKIATSFVRRIPGIIMSIASLSFLGFFKSDSANLGQVLIKANESSSNNIWALLLPTLILLSLSLSLHFVALGVHDSLDPRVIIGKK